MEHFQYSDLHDGATLTRTLSARVSVVKEQSKARVVTVASIYYTLTMHAVAHMFKNCNPFPEARHGLFGTDHMWNFHY
jgi:hypothetical protein